MLRFISHLPNRTIEADGQEHLFFSGTSYLGMAQNVDFQRYMANSLPIYGTVFGVSRNGNLQLNIYQEAEAKLAQTATAPAALTVSSGMLAGQAVVRYLAAEAQRTGAKFVYGPGAHPALWRETETVLPNLSFLLWCNSLTQRPARPCIILTNALNPGQPELFSFDWVADLPVGQPITLVVDDSHGLGLMNNGRGVWPQIPAHPNVRLIVTASLAKAMGMPGGVIFSDAETLASIRQTAFFAGCSPIPPAYLAAFCQADALYSQARQTLADRVALAEKLLLPTGLFRQECGYPVFYTDRDDLYPFLLENGIFIYSFAYPTAADKPTTRIIISAFHQPKDIHRLADCIHEKFKF
jgi:8-amino-7-oxononanoate synthase